MFAERHWKIISGRRRRVRNPMAFFCYTCESEGETIERQFPCGEAPWLVEVDGKIYGRDIAAEWRGRNKVRGEGGAWQLSESNGIVGNDETLRSAKELDARLGAPIDYVAAGRGRWKAKFDSREQKNHWLKVHKRVDPDAGYSDPAPGDFRGKFPGEFE